MKQCESTIYVRGDEGGETADVRCDLKKGHKNSPHYFMAEKLEYEIFWGKRPQK